MKRTDFFMKVITAVLFLAVVCYIGVYVYNALINTYVTIPAMSYSIEESCRAQGYIVRTETILGDTGSAATPIVADGEKIASGQAVAVEYSSSEALETAGELRALRLRIAQLEAPGGSVTSVCLENVMALSAAVHSGDLSRLDELSINIASYVFTGEDETGSGLQALQSRLEALENRSSGVRTVYSPVSGVFTQAIDGFERVGPGSLADISPSGLADLFRSPSTTAGAGKLVTEFRWYYAAVMDAGDAARLTEGRPVAVQFTGVYRAMFDMRVESVGRRDEDGECVVVFSSDLSVHEIAPLRFIRAEVIFDVVSGIYVPKEAIRLDDEGATFVYLQTGVRAERVDVEIIYDAGDSYLVRDGAETGSPLRAGSTIIVKANKLFDGKVVG